mmetsp:Transcript_36227/g.104390  ORF Transcript_36227/g.104390 Transcript_36227/m.104390 type:complete len:442 (-) Transcript_36227:1913-3238(-)
MKPRACTLSRDIPAKPVSRSNTFTVNCLATVGSPVSAFSSLSASRTLVPEATLMAPNFWPCAPLVSKSQPVYVFFGTTARSTDCPSTSATPKYRNKAGSAPAKPMWLRRDTSRYMDGSNQSRTPDTIWQGSACSSGPSQKAPSPRPWVLIWRCRRFKPEHLPEQELHSSQSSNSQSWLSTQGTSRLQARCSTARPTAGWPQSFASTLMSLTRHVCPPLQLAEHGSQGCQSSHTPSTQTFSWHLCMLQPSTCSLSMAAHGLQPGSGDLVMCRMRTRCPPSHGLLHVPHSSQSPHRQSLQTHSFKSSHGFTSLRCWLHPCPSSHGREVNSRARSVKPAPHVALHFDQADQSLTMQSCEAQGSSAQPSVSMSRSGQGSPPPLGFTMTSRSRVLWPPPQDLSQESQGVQSETLQSTIRSQASVSFSAPSHGEPRPSGSTSMRRIR